MQSQGLCCDPLTRLQHHVLPSHAARISHVSPGHRLSRHAAVENQLGLEKSLLGVRHFTDLSVSESKIFHPVLYVQLRAFLGWILQLLTADRGGSLPIDTWEAPGKDFRAIILPLRWDSSWGWPSILQELGWFWC